jgi:hypothetical protein
LIANDMLPIHRSCPDCQQTFTVSVAEQEFLRDLAARKGGHFHLPRRCMSCRHARRQARYAQPVDDNNVTECLTCVTCGQSFLFGGRDREFFARRGFAKPKRCRTCRINRHVDGNSRQESHT